ncbi:uncharacterized protein LOC105158712 [Sesamum indicum]|uniref:Uncharacterized protein LOC105158712 n=1 Tax=Sesamum indicum TaxID=4182 RepID=A0A8M8UX21_SESIN|nr:uncharacterized protein LOC105158712 [Sesamum indicum]
MEYSYSYTCYSSASSSSNSSTDPEFPSRYQRDVDSRKPPRSLRSARRYPAKNTVITKQPIAPLPPTRPKIYKVDSVDFKAVVQKLTGALEFQRSTRLQEVAPPPLSLSPSTIFDHASVEKPNYLASGNFGAADEEEIRRKSFDNSSGITLSPVGFISLSPSSLAWCSSVLLSPGTLASFHPSALL